MRLTTPQEVRAAIARHIIGDAEHGRVLGSVTLRRHQCDALIRLRKLIRHHGGALLADEVGLGKTYVALALAAEIGRPVVVAPASLRAMWRGSSERTGIELRFVSMELLGNGGTVPPTDFIIVDEAHHFRNQGTRRYAQLSEACARSRVLLLSATPVQNALDDLRRLLALILGHQAFAFTNRELAALIVRRGASALTGNGLPSIAEPVPVSIESDVDCLDALCALPPPVPLSDGNEANALLTFGLVRQWASSRAALIAALQRRMAMARAMEDALMCGKRISRAELALWRFADGAQQLAFPELTSGIAELGPEMLAQVHAHHDAVRGLIAWLRYHPDPDRVRAQQLLAIARRHPGERIVAFAEFAETIASLYRCLAPSVRAAMLTHGGGRVAGGPVSRSEILRQFGSNDAVPEHARIELLLTTDVLSEGVDLQSASVAIHLDLPWNPARIEQRVGRLRRWGAARDVISVYVFAPPAPAEKVLQLDRRLRAKLGEAARSVGLAGTILPGVPQTADAAVQRRERLLKVLQRWLSPRRFPGGPIAAAVRYSKPGAIACVRARGAPEIVALWNDGVEPEPSAELLAELEDAMPGQCSAVEVASAVRRISAWLDRGALAGIIELPASATARSRQRILRRVNSIARHARRHERTGISASLGAARRAATVTMPAGAERVLADLAGAPLPDDAWLRAIAEFAAIHMREAVDGPDEVLALLLLVSAG